MKLIFQGSDFFLRVSPTVCATGYWGHGKALLKHKYGQKLYFEAQGMGFVVVQLSSSSGEVWLADHWVLVQPKWETIEMQV